MHFTSALSLLLSDIASRQPYLSSHTPPRTSLSTHLPSNLFPRVSSALRVGRHPSRELRHTRSCDSRRATSDWAPRSALVPSRAAEGARERSLRCVGSRRIQVWPRSRPDAVGGWSDGGVHHESRRFSFAAHTSAEIASCKRENTTQVQPRSRASLRTADAISLGDVYSQQPGQRT